MPVGRPTDVIWILHRGFMKLVRRVAGPNRCRQVGKIAVNDFCKFPIVGFGLPSALIRLRFLWYPPRVGRPDRMDVPLRRFPHCFWRDCQSDSHGQQFREEAHELARRCRLPHSQTLPGYYHALPWDSLDLQRNSADYLLLHCSQLC